VNWKVTTKKKNHFFSVHIKLYYLIIIIIINNNSHYFTTQVINTTIHHLQNSISCCVEMAEQGSEVECSGHMTRQGFGEATVPSHKYSNTDTEQLFNNSITHDVLI